jgi:putative ABC transport system ATP-binding protein
VPLESALHFLCLALPLSLLSMSDREFILEVDEVTKAYGAVEVLHGVNLQVRAGERVALTGPSGSGKSTLLNCLCGIEPIDAGRISIAGECLQRESREQLDRLRREQIGYVFQSFHLLPTLSALENVELPGQLIGMDRSERVERAQQLLHAVGLAHRAGHRPDSLSGGERQRVALARAVMHRPRLILADEPTGSLDSVNGAKVLDLLESLSQTHQIAVLLVTHDRASTRICERVVAMRDGRIVESLES